jgi:hypothetical protein
MSDVIKRAAQMIAELAKLEASLRLAAAERDVLRMRVAELESSIGTDPGNWTRSGCAPTSGGDDHERPYLRQLPSGDSEKVYPKGWPTPPGPKRPNIIRRREALRGGER